ncbi:hypothetical protein BDQ12DRAFT_694010 [Crucibulum laeve]|uniref:DUF6533 domain-containing protein n=1 Tax=Crucibulum laeve TaxID=68775 RepID=A0A5C3LHX8_9AGAR|nr:hypothetical protein BDQ12DRAFT_694010 [Crucibulum laeve]
MLDDKVATLNGVYARNSSSLGALLLLLLEVVATSGDEYQYIWRRPRTAVNYLYLFSRYFGIISQTINCSMIFGPLSRRPVRPDLCNAWMHFEMISAQLLLTTLEGILMWRVYALYQQSWRVGTFLTSVFILDIILAAILGRRTLPMLQFDELCTGYGAPRDVLYFGASVLATQSMIWVMTFLKRNIACGGAPVVHLMIRDGVCVFVLLCAIFSVSIPYSFLESLAAHIVFFWPISLMSIATCRVILNMQRLKVPSASLSDIEFTSHIGISISNISSYTL